ncbi:hypothetical protein C0Q70_07123 [Pomacea canaliculata]|uniref:Secreted protein n=1 Tax=Pomacea canaliculata TaxID=400727 RepID=A0A2T7PE61_POMCA|nr:hypothetical protein C0Q70_07123 [Pomacea canaliculata]
MFLTIGLVPMLVSTVAFLPKTRVPWPLPVDYGKRRHQSLDENLLRKQRAWQRRLSDMCCLSLSLHLYDDGSCLYPPSHVTAGFLCRGRCGEASAPILPLLAHDEATIVCGYGHVARCPRAARGRHGNAPGRSGSLVTFRVFRLSHVDYKRRSENKLEEEEEEEEEA